MVVSHKYRSASPKLGEPARKGSASPPQRGGMDLYNIQHIISHFDDRIAEWSKKNKIRSLKPQNVIGSVW
jgi:hypothetical protein